MKTKINEIRFDIRGKTAVLGGAFFLTAALTVPLHAADVSTSPTGNVIVRNGVLDIKETTSGSNLSNNFGTLPAAIIGWDNDFFPSSAPGRGLAVGSGNDLHGAGGYSAVIGKDNAITGNNLLVSGKGNSAVGYQSLVVGDDNHLDGPGGSYPDAYHSAAIGQGNIIASNHGYAFGYSNNITGDRGVALGSGLLVGHSMVVALGRFNQATNSDDVLVIGTGATTGTRNTALRVTSDGGVILGRAQGDISMGIYQ